MKAFFDHNIEPFLARAVHIAVERLGDEAAALEDKFARNISDRDWITHLGEEGGWTIFSSDKRILKNRIERKALHTAGLTAFFFRPSVQKQTAIQRTATVLWHWEKLRGFVPQQSRGLYWMPVNKSAKFEAI